MERALSERLSAVLSAIPECETLADVGCDHGLISIYAVKSGRAKRVTASDIRKGPLDAAKRAVSAEGLSDVIETRLADGLCGISEHDCVVIAGMGGETIADILSRAPWTKECGRSLVLQPMTKHERLRAFLYDNGYDIMEEHFVREDGHLYCIITATGAPMRARAPYERYISESAISVPLCREYADKIIARLEAELKNRISANAIERDERAYRECVLASLKERRKKL